MFFPTFLKVTTVLIAGLAFTGTSGVAATGSCNTGSMECCKQVYSSKNPKAIKALTQNGIALGDVTGMVGVQCTPITGVGLGSGGHCTSQAVCCNQSKWGGAVAIGCNSVSL